MPPKSRSTTSKAAAAPKASLGFSSTKKAVAGAKASGKKAGGSSESAGQAAAPPKSTLAGLYPRLFKVAQKKMGPAIHRDELDDIEIILRVFDAEEDFGPSSRISRLERFERAEKMGLNPDPELGEILRSDEGKTRSTYAQSVFQI